MRRATPRRLRLASGLGPAMPHCNTARSAAQRLLCVATRARRSARRRTSSSAPLQPSDRLAVPAIGPMLGGGSTRLARRRLWAHVLVEQLCFRCRSTTLARIEDPEDQHPPIEADRQNVPDAHARGCALQLLAVGPHPPVGDHALCQRTRLGHPREEQPFVDALPWPDLAQRTAFGLKRAASARGTETTLVARARSNASVDADTLARAGVTSCSSRP